MVLPVSYSINLKFDKQTVWSIISKPGNLNYFHPFCKSNKVICWESNKHEDVLEYLNGIVLHREFYKWDEGEGYALNIGRKNGRKSKVIWSISGGKITKLNITVYPHVLSRYNKVKYILAYILFIRPGLKKYLKSVLNGVKWHLENEKTTPRNQFGRHKWFS